MKIKRATLFPALCCGAIGLLMMIWPADAPWGGDDVTLITTAIKANQQHRLVTGGLGGTFGYPYGPIPMQIYQLLAIFSHDPVMLVRIHAGLFAAVTAFALLWLSDVLNLSPWLAPMTMLGPFFWFYCRLLWDNTFAIPIGTLLLASYGDYLRRESRVSFYTAVMCAVALPLIHPMTLPLVVAIAIHGFGCLAIARAGRPGIDQQAAPFTDRSPAFRPGLLKKSWRGLIVIAIVTTLLSGPYFLRIIQQIGQSSALLPPRSDALTRTSALAFPLLAGRLFCAYGFFDARGPEIGWEQNRIVVLGRMVSLLVYPVIWIGLAFSIRRFAKQSAVISIGVTALLLQSLMDAALRISPYPHYYCGTWAAAVVMLWVGLSRLPMRKTIALIYAASLCIATIAFAIDIHTHSGGSVWYGPSLASQMKIAR